MTDIESISSSRPGSPGSLVMAEINEAKTRNKWLHMYFPDLELSQTCVADFSCALNQDYLRQGRMYITPDYLCFHSFIGPTKLVVPITDIEELIPKSVLKIPTAMVVKTLQTRHEFTSFLFRDKCIKYLATIRRKHKKDSFEDTTISELSKDIKVLQTNTQEHPQPPTLLNIKLFAGIGAIILVYQLYLLSRVAFIAFSY